MRRVYVYRHEGQTIGCEPHAYSLAYYTEQTRGACVHEVEAAGLTRAKIHAEAIRDHRVRCGNRVTSRDYIQDEYRKLAREAILGYKNLPEPLEHEARAREYRVAVAIRAAREDERTACWRIAADKFNECGLLDVQDVFRAIAGRGVTPGM